ncbi:unnamed protein product [Durusdinium trenchii]|uniref:Protein ENHANCED DISEASE RESISTANCE 2 C-terminal domain-containing protein n=1 Tax=Durusdinium trenchii TaxID=1381693 RepID=A0ABP0SPH6_9DINO
MLLLLAGCFALAGWRITASVLAIWGLHRLLHWWRGISIFIDGMQVYGKAKPKSFKDSASHSSPRRKGRASERTEGFMTPKSEASEDFVEWAPFWPSLPCGPCAEGSTSPFAELPSEAEVQPYWLQCDAFVFDVRNIGYKHSREKIPSQFALYECVGMDIVRDHRRIDCIMDRWDSGDLPANWPGARWEQSWKVPRVLVFNCQVPYTAGKIFGSYPDEDGGFSILNYFVLSREASALLASNAATPALQLWKRFVEEGVSTKEGISLKVVGRVEDLDKHEVPESFKRFNNKPVLLTRSATVYKKRLPEMLEIDFDVRNWNYPTRAAMVSYHHRAREAEVEIGYLLEGKADDELPEQILGCFTVNNMDIMAARWLT